MKSTGVVRRIDELGRIVVPKEMRRVLRIREGDSLEISADTDAITLKKYSLVESIDNFITQYVDAVHASSKKEIIVTDMEKVLAASNGFKKSIIVRCFSVVRVGHVIAGDAQVWHVSHSGNGRSIKEHVSYTQTTIPKQTAFIIN